VFDAADRARDLARDERLAAPLRLVVEEDAVGGEEPIRLAVVLRDVERVRLGSGVGAARVKRRRLALRRFDDLAVELARARLIEAAVDPNLRIASRIRTVPSAVISPVYSGMSNDTRTWLCAARL